MRRPLRRGFGLRATLLSPRLGQRVTGIESIGLWVMAQGLLRTLIEPNVPSGHEGRA